MGIVFDGAAGKLHIGEPELFVNNQARNRSGHLSHAMTEYQPGRILAFNSNCSAVRLGGHAAFGWVEYRRSEDYGRTWSEPQDLPYSRQVFFEGVHTVSVEKAVTCGGIVTIFALRNCQFSPGCHEPWTTVMVLRSFDHGRTWSEPTELCPFAGRVYDARVHDGIIYAMIFCNPNHMGEKPEDLYRLYRSTDRGETFELVGVIDLETVGHSYGALQFRPDGSLAAYSNNLQNGCLLSESVSRDLGRTWERLPETNLAYGIRNIQIAPLGGGYVIHGRAWLHAQYGKGQVIYTSADGLHWDDGILLEKEKTSCYYSNMLPLRLPDGHEEVLLQYSDGYDGSRVNVIHRFLQLK